MKYFFACLFFLPPIISFAQKVIDVSKQDGGATNTNIFLVVGGEPFVNTKFIRLVEGSPYFSDEWMNGIALMDSGSRYSGILKLDLMENRIHFKDQGGNEMIATTRVRQLILIDTIKQTAFNFIHSSSLNTKDPESKWYQLLAEAPSAKLYKQSIRNLQEIKPYGSATVEQYIKTTNQYFLLYKERLVAVKKIKDLADILAHKKQEILKYISDNNVNGKSDNDFINVMSFYKSLQQ